MAQYDETSPATVHAAMCRGICIVIMVAVQAFTTRDTMLKFPQYWSLVYAIGISVVSICAAYRYRKNGITANIIDVTLYAILLYITCLTAYFSNHDAFIIISTQVVPVAASTFFLLICLRLFWRGAWPAIGFFSRRAEECETPPTRWHRALLALAVALVVVIAFQAKHFPQGWSLWVIGTAGFYLAFFQWPKITSRAVIMTEDKEEIRSDIEILRDMYHREFNRR